LIAQKDKLSLGMRESEMEKSKVWMEREGETVEKV